MFETRINDDIREMWSVPWHALHRNLALKLVADTTTASIARLDHRQMPGAAPCTNTWLSRGRRRATLRQRVIRFATP
jgi:hypothetical protein